LWAALDLPLHVAALLSRPPGSRPWARPRLFPGVFGPIPLPRGESRLVFQHLALRQASERNIGESETHFAERGTRDVELSLAAVHHQQVGQVLLLDTALQPARQHLEHRGEIVSCRVTTHLEEPVAALVRLAVAEDHLRPDAELPLEGGDVVTLDPPRQPRQA